MADNDLGQLPIDPAADLNAAPEPASTVEQDTPETAPEKTFTQAELDEIVEKRLSRERRKLEKFERQHEIDQRVAAELAQRERQQQPPINDAPKRENFESLEEYLEAKADWKVEQKLRERDAEYEARDRQRQAQAHAETLEQSWRQRVDKAAEQYKDFADVVLRNDDLPITQVMGQAIRSTDNVTDLAYFLGKNPEEAERISTLDAVNQVFELGRISATLKTDPKPISKAAPPIEPVKGGRSGTNDIYDPSLSFEQYKRLREAQLKRAN